MYLKIFDVISHCPSAFVLLRVLVRDPPNCDPCTTLNSAPAIKQTVAGNMWQKFYTAPSKSRKAIHLSTFYSLSTSFQFFFLNITWKLIEMESNVLYHTICDNKTKVLEMYLVKDNQLFSSLPSFWPIVSSWERHNQGCAPQLFPVLSLVPWSPKLASDWPDVVGAQAWRWHQCPLPLWQGRRAAHNQQTTHSNFNTFLLGILIMIDEH